MSCVQTAFDFDMSRAPGPALTLEGTRISSTSAELLARLPARLEQSLGQRVILNFTDNTRTMVSSRTREGIMHVRLHHMFTRATHAVCEAIVRFLVGSDRDAGRELQRFVDAQRELIRRREPSVASIRQVGSHHDLVAILDQLNRELFEDKVLARIGWGRRAPARARGRRRRRSIKLGSYLGRHAGGGPLIRVHPVLDADWVPSFFVEYIVYHEMLHHVVQMPVQRGRRSLHGPEFKARERLFPRFAEALTWERTHIDRLLSS